MLCLCELCFVLPSFVVVNVVGSDVAREPALVAYFLVVSSEIVGFSACRMLRWCYCPSYSRCTGASFVIQISHHAHVHDNLRDVNIGLRRSMHLRSQSRELPSLRPIEWHP
jgi:hypothetical protein